MTTDPEKKARNFQIVANHYQTGGGSANTSEEEKPQDSPKSGLKKWGAWTIPIIFLLSKFKWVAVLLKFTKLSTLLTMLAAIWVYAQLWGASFAIGFVLLIYIHEMGHALVMHKLGIRAGAPIFIPFVGAIIAMKQRPQSAYAECLVGAGGPVLGSLGAMICLVVGWLSGSEFFYALALVGFMLNLFNMLPILPLDGGRMTRFIGRTINIAGLLIGGVVFYYIQSPILLIILIFGLFSLFKKENLPSDYFDASPASKQAMGILYFVMVFLMAGGMWLAEKPLMHLSQ